MTAPKPATKFRHAHRDRPQDRRPTSASTTTPRPTSRSSPRCRAGRSRSAISSKDKPATCGEQTPAYAIGFELYENGISRALTLDYNDFVVTGKLTSLEIKDTQAVPVN